MKQGRKRKTATVDYIAPTAEQIANGHFHRELVTYRRTAMIDTLRDAGKLKPAEYDALRYYRDQALTAEDDHKAENALSPEKVMGGGSGGSPCDLPANWAWTPAIAETARIERDMGILRDIARAIAVDDLSLSQWCIGKHGGRERYGAGGKFIAMVPNCEKRVMEVAMKELRYAAGAIIR